MIPRRAFAPTLAATALVLTLSTAAVAQTGTPVNRADLTPVARMNMAVSASAVAYLLEGDLLGHGDVIRLSLIARQKVMAQTCDGFDLDPARYTAALNAVLLPFAQLELPERVGPGDTFVNLPFTRVMAGFTMLLGGNTAIAAYDPNGFCASGADLREQLVEAEEENLLIWADPD